MTALRELGVGKRYGTITDTRKSENNNSEAGPIISAHENNTATESKTRILTQKEVDEQIRHYRHFVDLIQLIRAMSIAHR